MGAQLVGQAFIFAKEYAALQATDRGARKGLGLKPNEFRLLVWIALTALDTDRAPRYFAKRERSALGLGWMVPDAVDTEDPSFSEVDRQRTSAFQGVKLAMSGLTKAGAIRNVRRGREGTTAEYVLTFPDWLAAHLLGTSSIPLQSRDVIPLSGRKLVRGPVRNPYPLGTTDDYKELDRRESRHPAEPHVSLVDKSSVRGIA